MFGFEKIVIYGPLIQTVPVYFVGHYCEFTNQGYPPM